MGSHCSPPDLLRGGGGQPAAAPSRWSSRYYHYPPFIRSPWRVRTDARMRKARGTDAWGLHIQNHNQDTLGMCVGSTLQRERILMRPARREKRSQKSEEGAPRKSGSICLTELDFRRASGAGTTQSGGAPPNPRTVRANSARSSGASPWSTFDRGSQQLAPGRRPWVAQIAGAHGTCLERNWPNICPDSENLRGSSFRNTGDPYELFPGIRPREAPTLGAISTEFGPKCPQLESFCQPGILLKHLR